MYLLGKSPPAPSEGLSLMTSSWSSAALNTLLRAACAQGSLGIISGMLSAESLHSGYSVRVVVEFGIPDDVGNELLGILVDGNDASVDTIDSK